MDTAEIRRRWLDFFAATVTRSSRAPRCCSTTPTCCSSTPAWCRSSRTSSGQETPPYDRAPSACRSACAPPTSRRSARPPGTARSSRCAATSPSATTSRKARSSSPGSWSPSPSADGGYGFDPRPALAHRLRGRRRGRRALAEGHRPARRADPAAAARRQLLVAWACPARAARARRSYYDRGPEYGARRRPGRRRGPLPRDLEPRLHAGRARARSAPRTDFDIAGPLPQQEHRHRHGPGAGRAAAAGRRQHVRDRRGVPRHRAGPPSSPGARYGAGRTSRRRPVPRRRRPRPLAR